MSHVAVVEIGILVYPGAQIATVLGLADLFALAQRIASDQGEPQSTVFRVSQWQRRDGPDDPVRVQDSLPSAMTSPTILIIPPSLESPISPTAAAPFGNWLKRLHADGATLASVCAGAFLLGETGLLNGRTVTTHWHYVDSWMERFPDVSLNVDQLIIDDDDIITAGGVMAWTDIGLRLVDRYLGASVMIGTAQMLLLDAPGRQQRYYSAFSPRLAHGDEAVLIVQRWLQDTDSKTVTLKDMAQRAGLHVRTFSRRFQKATGMTTTEYCQRLRIGRARGMLHSSQLPIERVAWDVGYSDPGAFRKVFTRVVGLSPGEYRRRFSTAAST